MDWAEYMQVSIVRPGFVHHILYKNWCMDLIVCSPSSPCASGILNLKTGRRDLKLERVLYRWRMHLIRKDFPGRGSGTQIKLNAPIFFLSQLVWGTLFLPPLSIYKKYVTVVAFYTNYRWEHLFLDVVSLEYEALNRFQVHFPFAKYVEEIVIRYSKINNMIKLINFIKIVIWKPQSS